MKKGNRSRFPLLSWSCRSQERTPDMPRSASLVSLKRFTTIGNMSMATSGWVFMKDMNSQAASTRQLVGSTADRKSVV